MYNNNIIILIAKCILLLMSLCCEHRCVANEERHLALGLLSFIARLLGAIPGPLIVGALFDSACLLFNNQGNTVGSCLVYDNDVLGLRSLALYVVIAAVSAALAFCSWLTYPAKADKKATTTTTVQETTE